MKSKIHESHKKKITNMSNKEQLKGSQTAKNGFLNEDDIVDKFNNWNTDEDAQKWLSIMQYD